MVGRGRSGRGGRGGGRVSSVQTRSSADQHEENPETTESMAKNNPISITPIEGRTKNSEVGGELEEGSNTQLENLKRKFNQLKDMFENLDRDQPRVSKNNELSKQQQKEETVKKVQQVEEESEDGKCTQLEELKHQIAHLKEKFDALDRSKQGSKLTPIENTVTGNPTTTWKHKLMPKLSQKGNNTPKPYLRQDATTGLEAQTLRNKESKNSSFQQRILTKTPTPNTHENEGGECKTMYNLGRGLTCYTNKEKDMKNPEKQDKAPKDQTTTGDMTAELAGCQQTLRQVQRPPGEHVDPTKGSNGISLHGPRSQGPRTLLIIHQEHLGEG